MVKTIALLIFVASNVSGFCATAGFPGALGTETTGYLNIGAVQKQKSSASAAPSFFGTETTNYLGIGAVQRDSGPGPLTGGSITSTNSAVDSVTINWSSATGGTAPITEQLQMTANPVGTWTNVSGATTSPGYALSLAASTTYNFRVAFTDSTPTTVYSTTNAVTTAATAVIAITTPVAYQVKHRSGLANDLAITGTYTGTPTSIEAKWGTGPWTTIVASPPAAGPGTNFSGTLPKQFQGQGTLQVRFVNDTSITASKANVGVGLVLEVIGQSNAVGLGTSNQVYTNSLVACLFGNDYVFKELVDPYDSNVAQVDSISDDGGQSAGSWVPLLATELENYFQCPVEFVPAAKGSTSVTQWQPGSGHTDRATLYGSSVYRGLQTRPGLLLWWQGETDAAAGMIQATYQSNFETMASNYRTDLGIKVMPFELQTCTLSGTEAGAPAIRSAISAEWGSNTNVVVGPDLSVLTADGANEVHIKSSTNLLAAARLIAEKIKPVFYSAHKSTGFW